MSEKKVSVTFKGDVAERLDKALFSLLSKKLGASRSQLKTWIEAGHVLVDGKTCTKPAFILTKESKLQVARPAAEPISITPQEIPLEIIYEDSEILVLNKQPQLIVHPGAGAKDNTLMNALAAHFQKQKLKDPPERMGIVHRLDKDTTGVLVVCKTEKCLRNISAQFADRTVRKKYTALVFTTPRGRQIVSTQDSGTVETTIARHPTIRTKMAVVSEKGRNAITKWSVVERFTYGALLCVEILTGRTHQIRVHMEYIRSPIVGDPTYGNFSGMQEPLKRAASDFGRQALHASELTLIHPKTEKVMTWKAPLPKDFQSLVSRFRSNS